MRGWGWEGSGGEEKAVSSQLLCSAASSFSLQLPHLQIFSLPLALCILISIFFPSWYLCPFFFHLPHPFPPTCQNGASLPPSLSGCVRGSGGRVWGISHPLFACHTPFLHLSKVSSLLCGCISPSRRLFSFVVCPLPPPHSVDVFLFSPHFPVCAGPHLSLCPSPPWYLPLFHGVVHSRPCSCSATSLQREVLVSLVGSFISFFPFLSLCFFSSPLSVLLSFPLSPLLPLL